MHQKRLACYNTGVLYNNDNYSEILYCIEFDRLKLRSQIYMGNNHSKYDDFKKLSFDKEVFKTYDFDFGYCYYLNTDLGQFLNDENSDKSIKDWFLNSFEQLKKLMDDNSIFNK